MNALSFKIHADLDGYLDDPVMGQVNGRAICEVICILQIACWWTVPQGWTPQIARPLGGKPGGISTQRKDLRHPPCLRQA